MRFKEVHYSRLFNLRDYQNEKIGFTVELDESDSPKEVIGLLYNLVYSIESVLDLHRAVKRRLEDLRDRKKSLNQRIQGMERRIEELLKWIEEDSDDICRVKDYEQEISNLRRIIKEDKEKIKEIGERIESLTQLLEKVEKAIRDGSFEEAFIEVEKLTEGADKDV